MQIWHVSLHIFALANIYNTGELHFSLWVDNGHMESRQSLGISLTDVPNLRHMHLSFRLQTKVTCSQHKQHCLFIKTPPQNGFICSGTHSRVAGNIMQVENSQASVSIWEDLKRLFKLCAFLAPILNVMNISNECTANALTLSECVCVCSCSGEVHVHHADGHWDDQTERKKKGPLQVLLPGRAQVVHQMATLEETGQGQKWVISAAWVTSGQVCVTVRTIISTVDLEPGCCHSLVQSCLCVVVLALLKLCGKLKWETSEAIQHCFSIS